MRVQRRVIAYVDGYNLYYGIRAAGFRKYLWLNIQGMVAEFLQSDQALIKTKYFTSRVASPSDSKQRQSAYIDAIKSLGVEVFEGRHGGEAETCECGRHYATHSEKMTDVNIALAVARDAHTDAFDTAFIVTGDSDQVPTIKLVRDLFPAKRVVVLFPPKRDSRHFELVANVTLNINERSLRQNQLPDVVTHNGIKLVRPEAWSAPVLNARKG